MEFTQEQKAWLKKIYPTLNKEWRLAVRRWYFQKQYSDGEQRNLKHLAKYYKENNGKTWTKKISLKDYL